MEPVNASCETWRELLAMRALGDLASTKRPGSRAHLEGCRDCRDVARRSSVKRPQHAPYVDPRAVEPHRRRVPSR